MQTADKFSIVPIVAAVIVVALLWYGVRALLNRRDERAIAAAKKRDRKAINDQQKLGEAFSKALARRASGEDGWAAHVKPDRSRIRGIYIINIYGVREGKLESMVSIELRLQEFKVEGGRPIAVTYYPSEHFVEYEATEVGRKDALDDVVAYLAPELKEG